MADIDELARRFSEAAHDRQSRSPLYAGLNRSIAQHPHIVALLSAAPVEQQLPVLLLAAVHSILLAEPDLELACWYPTTTDEPRRSDPFPAFSRLCVDRDDEIRTIVASRSVQTNEVGRCALLLPGLAAIAGETGPISLIDIGASAGLNLQLDRYAYEYVPGRRVGDSSPVLLSCSTRGDVELPAGVPSIVDRVGIDRSPVDIRDPAEARWLLACVWPDQPDRFVRLRAAIEIAIDAPPTLFRGDAVDLLATTVRSAARHGHPVVVNSWTLNYLPPERQRAYVDTLDGLGAELDLSWVYAESPGMCPGVPFPPDLRDEHITVLMLTRWRNANKESRSLGTAHPHGYWWHAPA